MRFLKISILSLAFLSLLWSCQTIDPSVDYKQKSFSVTINADGTGDASTKTVFSENLDGGAHKAVWGRGDRLGVFATWNKGSGIEFSNSGVVQGFDIINPLSKETLEKASFEGILSGPGDDVYRDYTYYSFYPYSPINVSDVSAVPLLLPTIQYPTTESWDPKADFLIGKPKVLNSKSLATSAQMSFSRLFSLLRLSFGTEFSTKGYYSERVLQIKLSSSDASDKLSGNFTANFTDASFSMSGSGTFNYVIADYSSSNVLFKDLVSWIMLPAGTYSSVTIEVTTTNNIITLSRSGLTLTRGTLTKGILRPSDSDQVKEGLGVLLLNETFGTTGNKASVSSYSGWSKEGVGVGSDFSYTAPSTNSSNTNIRNTLPSSGYTDASGGCNMFFSGGGTAANEEFLVNNISVFGAQNILITFGSYSNAPSLFYSVDGGAWVSTTISRTGTNWQLATVSSFSLPSGAQKLSLKFASPKGKEIRIDDLKVWKQGGSSVASPTVTTGEATGITANSALVTGSYNYSGSEVISEVGIGFRRSSEYTYQHRAAASVSTSFSVNLTSLQSGTNYVCAAYVKIGSSYFYGAQTLFNTLVTLSLEPHPGTFSGLNSSTINQWMELPVLPSVSNIPNGYAYVSHYTTDKGGKSVRNYSMLYDAYYKVALWVAYPLASNYLGTTNRTDKWAYDPKIPTSMQPRLTSGWGSGLGFDRGHQLPSADRTCSVNANEATFFFSNMTAQVSMLNQRVWERLENQGRTWAGQCDTLYIVTGGVLKTSSNTTITYTPDNDGKNIAVPKAYFKIFLKRKISSGVSTYSSIGFWYENRDYGAISPQPEHVKSVTEIETLTGFTFFPQLPSGIAASVKSNSNSSGWL